MRDKRVLLCGKTAVNIIHCLLLSSQQWASLVAVLPSLTGEFYWIGTECIIYVLPCLLKYNSSLKTGMQKPGDRGKGRQGA